MSLLLSSFYPNANAVLTSGNQTISGVKTFNNAIRVSEIRGTGIGGAAGGQIDLQNRQLYAGSNFVSLDYFRRILSGNWEFENRPRVSGIGVLLQGEAAGGGETVILPNNILFTTGSQTITSSKNFTTRPTLSGINLITTGDLVNLELNILGLENFVNKNQNQDISGIKNFDSRPTVRGSGVLLQGETAPTTLDPFDGNRPIKRIPSFSDPQPYGGTTISGFLENMFFPFISGSVSLNSFPIYTYGINSLSAISFTGNIILNDSSITGLAFLSGSTILRGPSSRTVGGSFGQVSPQLISLGTTLTASTNEVYTARIYLTGGSGPGIVTSSAQRIRFEPRYYYGTSNNPNLGILITGLTASIPSTYTYPIGSRPSSVTHTGFMPNNEYIYFAYPSPNVVSPNTQEGIINWGNSLSSIFETNTNFEYISAYQNLGTINLFFQGPNKNLLYRVYRSNNLLSLLPGQSFTLRFTFGE